MFFLVHISFQGNKILGSSRLFLGVYILTGTQLVVITAFPEKPQAWMKCTEGAGWLAGRKFGMALKTFLFE